MSYAEAQYTIDEVLDGVKKMQVAGNEPTNLKEIKIIPGDGHVYLHFTPQDTVIDDQVITTVVGVIIRRKEGDYPEDENDGDLIGDFTGAELYKYTSQPYLDDGLTNGVEYYYRFFPYTAYGMMNRSLVNAVIGIPNKPTVWGFHQDFTNTDPASTITYLESAVNYNPMMTNIDAGAHTYGSWENWEWFKNVKPYSVNTDGVATYSLMETDVTKTLTGGSAPISDCMAWFPRIYMKEVYAADGNSRDVYFALNNDGDCADFIPVGFYNKQGEVMNGVWISMFYPTSSYASAINTTPGTTTELTKTTMINGINNKWGNRAACLGGPLMNVIRDLLYMLYKTTDIQSVSGYGYSATTSLKTTKVINEFDNGTYKANMGTKSNSTGLANRLFFCNTLATYNTKIVDYNTLFSGGIMYMCKQYEGLPGALDLYTEFSNIYYPSSETYPTKLTYLGDGFGSVPLAVSPIGSGSTGLCDAVSSKITSGKTYFATRIGYFAHKTANGPAFIKGDTTTDSTAELNLCEETIVPVVLPDVGYTPNYYGL